MATAAAAPSLVHGPVADALWTTTLSALIETQARLYPDRIAVSFPWQNVRRTYHELLLRSKLVAKALVDAQLRQGEAVGVIAGNCYEYIEVFLGASWLGCPVVVLNSTYTPQELSNAVTFSRCKALFLAQDSGPGKDLSAHAKLLVSKPGPLRHLVLLNGARRTSPSVNVLSYPEFVASGERSSLSEVTLSKLASNVRASDVLNLQFTSGTTGSPKAAMLTHFNLINDGKLIGDRMQLTPTDAVCCPPPLFHCFGLVIGFLASFTHGSSIVFASPQFDAHKVLDAVVAERCTILLGVPTMFIAVLDANRAKQLRVGSLRAALAAGSPVPQALMRRLEREMGVRHTLIAYGMTETSPVTFMSSLDDSERLRISTVGTLLPHCGAKIVDKDGAVVPRGTRGEICTSGFALQLGYWENEDKTKEVMQADEHGTVWMYTGDEGEIDADGYCSITGRIKDTIIRGGENIYPVEIEERLLAHAAINEASVVGLPDERYGEAVACFLRQTDATPRPDADAVAAWVRQTMGRHKAPKHVFWIGDDGVGQDFPKTGSGKHQKHILKDVGTRLLAQRAPRAKL